MARNIENSDFDFMSRKNLWFGISGLLLLPGIIGIIISMMTFGAPFKLGIDFTGGGLMDITFNKPVTATHIKERFAESGHEDAQVTIADEKTAIVRTKSMSAAERDKLFTELKAKEGEFKVNSFESVGPVIGKELLNNALLALGLALLGIVGYVSYRYQWDFAVCAIAALVHDVLFMAGVFAILGLTLGVEVDSLFVPAVLTVIGFSVHDTIIIYDRIRENMQNANKRDSFDDVANKAIRQTLTRSIYTSLTTMLTLLAMFLFGGETIRWFTFAMLLGIGIGAYSSIFNASQLLSVWRMMGVKSAEKRA
jgi:preprotein translocase subunit SecF